MAAFPPEDRYAVAARAEKFPPRGSFDCRVALGEGHDEALGRFLTELRNSAGDIPEVCEILHLEFQKAKYLFGMLDVTRMDRIRCILVPSIAWKADGHAVFYEPSSRSLEVFPPAPAAHFRSMVFRSIPKQEAKGFSVDLLRAHIARGIRHLSIDLRLVREPYAIADICEAHSIYLDAVVSPALVIAPTSRRQTRWVAATVEEWIEADHRPNRASIQPDIHDVMSIMALFTELKALKQHRSVSIKIPDLSKRELEKFLSVIKLGIDATDDMVFVELDTPSKKQKAIIADALYSRGIFTYQS